MLLWVYKKLCRTGVENLEVGESLEVSYRLQQTMDLHPESLCTSVDCGESFSTPFMSSQFCELISNDTAGEAGGLLCGLVKSSLLLCLLHSAEEYWPPSGTLEPLWYYGLYSVECVSKEGRWTMNLYQANFRCFCYCVFCILPGSVCQQRLRRPVCAKLAIIGIDFWYIDKISIVLAKTLLAESMYLVWCLI